VRGKKIVRKAGSRAMVFLLSEYSKRGSKGKEKGVHFPSCQGRGEPNRGGKGGPLYIIKIRQRAE